MINNNFEDILNNRKSVKVFDDQFKIPREEMDEMIQKATKAPSSVNMQPWRFLVVESDEGKDKLRPLIRFNTRQNDTSSAMVVIFGDMQSQTNGEEIYDNAVKHGFMPEEVKNEMLDKVVALYDSAPKEQMNDIVKIDSSLAAMQFMLVAKAHGYDTNPIGGFESDQIADAFDIDSERYVPVLIVAVGKAKNPAHDSYRLPTETVTKYV
ncbi:nitroreductase family protein [Staphylococcus pseudoxylosus]|uniref:nitroreductase family protein n=1 Tax=Staphylococcus pseudoxylosus TaxID=2282419 RepID=UPI000D1F11F4|nr:nitroreductase family protein [Staphylococcus pseudoxylosus]MEB5782520.1 nitroreductase family protein [Staphylococcus pseudoxylosus]PTI83923.1 nitroreductase family protein [Staphylococcus xylosus]